jgi:hypothetical protein
MDDGICDTEASVVTKKTKTGNQILGVVGLHFYDSPLYRWSRAQSEQ